MTMWKVASDVLYGITKFIFMKIYFHRKISLLRKFYATKFWSHVVYGCLIRVYLRYHTADGRKVNRSSL